MQITTMCIRCGKERVFVKTWNDTIGTIKTTYSTSVCPDKDCQKIVDRENEEKEAKKQRLLQKKQTFTSNRYHIKLK